MSSTKPWRMRFWGSLTCMAEVMRIQGDHERARALWEEFKKSRLMTFKPE